MTSKAAFDVAAAKGAVTFLLAVCHIRYSNPGVDRHAHIWLYLPQSP
jgi:hypothetical protein